MLLSELSIVSVFTEWVFPLALFFLGLGLVVFVHELGHFLAAKGVGIKVERFAFGFGKRLFGVKIGETDYCINVLPLGGYVKMLGQEDLKPLKENEKPDPRSYEAKSVGARFLVISAGVIMNIILAAVLFVTVGLVGREAPASVVGATGPGSPVSNAVITWDTPLAATSQPTTQGDKTPQFVGHPLYLTTDTAPATTGPIFEIVSAPASMPTTAAVAKLPPLALPPLPYDPWINRLQSGDVIKAMEGDSFVLKFNDGITSLQDVAMVAALAGPTDKYTLIIERTVDGVTRRGRLTSGVQSNGGMFSFGILPAVDMVVDKPESDESIMPLEADDKLVAINGRRVENQGQVDRIEKQYTGNPVQVTVLRKGKEETFTFAPTLFRAANVLIKKDGTPVTFTQASLTAGGMEYQLADGQKLTMNDDDQAMLSSLWILGMSPRLRVTAVVPGSSAEKAGIKLDDIILSYGERNLPTFSKLMEVNKDHAGEVVQMEVIRDGKTLTLEVKPKQRAEGVQIGLMSAPDQASPIVAQVLPGSVADNLGIAKGSTIQAINGRPVGSWIDIYQALAACEGKEAQIKFVTRGGQEKTARIVKLTPEMFSRGHYEFSTFKPLTFKPLTFNMKQPGVGAALAWGGKETVKLTLTSYASLRSLIAGWASVKHMSGPIGIGAMAVKAGQHGIMEFIYFLAFISSAIAVFNFLPLPVLDGGHALFLMIEKIRGKPVPVKILNYAQYVGLFLLLGIFLAVTYQDIARLLGTLW